MYHSSVKRFSVFFAAGCLMLFPGIVCGDSTFTYSGHTYQIITTPETWIDAAADAVARQMYNLPGALVRIDDQAENDYLIDQLLTAIPAGDFSSTKAPDGGNGSYVWIGATDRGSEGVWLWDGDNNGSGDQFWQGNKDGSPVGGRYHHWGTVNGVQYEPDDYNNNQDAAGICLNQWPVSSGSLGTTGQWNDVNANNSLYYVIEFNAVPEPTALSLLCGGSLLAAAGFYMRWRSGACKTQEKTYN
jgi:hypothetical protein